MPPQRPASTAAEALSAYSDTVSADAPIAAVPDGLLNDTYAVGQPPMFALQLVAARFNDIHNERMELVARTVAKGGMPAPELMRTASGQLSHPGPHGRRWRLCRWLPGTVHHSIPSTDHANSAAAALARFHDILLGDARTRRLPASSFHDTARYMLVLRRVLAKADREVGGVGRAILNAWDRAQTDSPGPAPWRPGHGDMKISNVLFQGGRASALIDLDTVAGHCLADDLGDALRSWCNRLDENSAAPDFDSEVFAASVDGYLGASRTISLREKQSIVPGTIRIALELASRFCADGVMQSYFAWDQSIAPDARGHNLLRARGQLALANELARRRDELNRYVGV